MHTTPVAPLAPLTPFPAVSFAGKPAPTSSCPRRRLGKEGSEEEGSRAATSPPTPCHRAATTPSPPATLGEPLAVPVLAREVFDAGRERAEREEEEDAGDVDPQIDGPR